jgi:very-short-patch-repair endonuclease
VAAIAERQHGVVATRQLVAAGISRSVVAKWACRERLHRVHRGVYAVGHVALSNERRWMSAVLACGEGAALSHASAAALWGLLRPVAGPVHVSVPNANGRARRDGIVIHRCSSLAAFGVSSLSTRHRQTRHEAPLVTVREGIPVTSVVRTVEDLRRGGYPERWVRRARRQAGLMGYELGDGAAPPRTRSDLEDDFLAFLRRHRLPSPEVNVKVGRWEVDFLWRAQRLAVETDFYDYHRGSVAFEDDHQREMDLRRAGLTVRRYTGAQLADYPAEIAGELGEIVG